MIIVYVDVFLSLNGTVIPDHGYVSISDIDAISLLCNTNRRPPHGSIHSGGDWYGPDETRVDGTSVPGVTRNRGSMVVRLRRTTGTAPEGIYRCSVPDAASTFQTIFVGLYNTGGGKSWFLKCWHSLVCTLRASIIVWWDEFHSP